MEVLRESKSETVHPKIIYGYFEIIGGYKFWRHAPNMGLSAEDQYNHNCDIDPDFRVLEPVNRG